MRYIIIVLLILSSYVFYKGYNDAISKDIVFGTGTMQILRQDGTDIDLKIKVADTINERERGLMNVEKMPEDEAMLFIFEDEAMRKMWMAETLIPLDMLFVDSKKVIFNMKENSTPLSRDLIYSVGPAKYVVELNAGFIRKHNIRSGDRIEFTIGR